MSGDRSENSQPLPDNDAQNDVANGSVDIDNGDINRDGIVSDRADKNFGPSPDRHNNDSAFDDDFDGRLPKHLNDEKGVEVFFPQN